MAVRTFQTTTVGSLTELTTFPYDLRSQNVRAIAILVTAGTGVVTVRFKDGTYLNTPRMTLNTPYEALFENELSEISAVGSLTAFDLELLKLGVA